jgi:hypothetical protein
MSAHTLKTWPEPFAAVADGTKTHEYRHDDRSFAVGDTLCLREWEPSVERFTGRMCVRIVTYISRDAFGIPPGYVVMSIGGILFEDAR